MASSNPHFTIGESESCASITSDSTNCSSANLMRHVASDLTQTPFCQKGRKCSLESCRTNPRYCGGNFSVIEETCQRCSENDISIRNAGCNHECGMGSDIVCQRCGGKKSTYYLEKKYCSEQCQKVSISYQKVKKYMIILSIVNVVLLFIVAGLISGGIIFLLKSKNPDVSITTTDAPLISKQTNLEKKCEIKCSDLVYRLNLIEEMNNLQKECCTLQDAVKYFVKYVNRNKRTNSSGIRPALQLKGGKPSNLPTQPANFIQNWAWDDKMRVKEDVKSDNDTVTILVSGHYYIFSRIHFSAKIKDGGTVSSSQLPVTHALFRRQVGGIFRSLQSSTIKCSIHQNTTIHSSFLEGIAYLRVGEQLKIGLNHGEYLEFISKNDNYFGLFKL